MLLLILVFLTFPFVAKAEEPAVGVSAVVEPILVKVGELRSFKADKKVSEFPHFKFTLDFKNIGTFPLAYEGEVAIFNMIGKETTKIPIVSNSVLISPGEEKKIEIKWDKSFGFGFYTVFLDFTYAQGHKGSVSTQTTVWVIPWRVIIFLLLTWLVFKWLYKRNA